MPDHHEAAGGLSDERLREIITRGHYVAARKSGYTRAAVNLAHDVWDLIEEINRLKRLTAGLADRVAAQSELLTRKAEAEGKE